METIKKPNPGQELSSFLMTETKSKDTLLSIETGLSIQNWLKENYHNSFTTNDVNSVFDVSLNDSDIWKIYKGDFALNFPKFSFYRAPVTNTTPAKEIDLLQLHKAITGNYYKNLTAQYRAMEPGADKANFKKNRFDHATIAGTFNNRKSDGLKQISKYACFDFDHVQEPENLKNLLISDPFLTPDLLFVSPSGNGLKMILFNDDGEQYDKFYSIVLNYLKNKYPTFAPNLDAKTKDIARTCFLCFDPDAYLKIQYLQLWQAHVN